MSNEIDKKLFKRIFRHTVETSANKLTNRTNKEENEIIVKNINGNKEKLYKQKRGDYVIQPSKRHIDSLTFLLKNILQIGQKKFLLLVKLKIQFLGHT